MGQKILAGDCHLAGSHRHAVAVLTRSFGGGPHTSRYQRYADQVRLERLGRSQ
jgi:hypothetical protein